LEDAFQQGVYLMLSPKSRQFPSYSQPWI
jgi:hypothetical protein